MKNFADKIIYGSIYTVDKKQPKAEVAAVKDGKFVYVERRQVQKILSEKIPRS